jgi:DNA-binding NtrC family response regulator
MDNRIEIEPVAELGDRVMIIDRAWDEPELSLRKSLWSDPQARKSLEGSIEALVSAYLTVNLNHKGISLKEIVWTLERKAMFASLRLSRGSQKEAAAILGIKVTTLFEKMRKHGINGRRMKISAKLKAGAPQEW